MPDREESEPRRGFKVEDRRRFTAEGESKPASEASSEAAPPGAEERQGFTLAGEPRAETEKPPPPGEINFTTFVISLGTQALAHLGDIPNPIDKSTAIDLVAAKELIDIIAMLAEKTKGNLDEVEAGLVERLLYDLRLRYVERVRSHPNRG